MDLFKNKFQVYPPMALKRFWVVLAVLALLLAGCTGSLSPPLVPNPNPPFTDTRPPSISVSSQTFENNMVLIDSVFLDKPGFVVIHLANPNGSTGEVIGNSFLIQGEKTNVEASVKNFNFPSANTVSVDFIAMLHYDNGDGQYTSLTEDKPVLIASTIPEQSTIVMKKFLVTKSAPAQPAPSPPSTGPKGNLEVILKDPQGNPLANAVVELFDGAGPNAPKIATQTTNALGKAVFSAISTGEVYVTAGDAEHAFQAASGEVEIKTGETTALTLNLTALLPEPQPPAPQAVAFSLENDDTGFYQSGTKITTLNASANATVNLTIFQRSANSAWGGADIKSSAFATFNVPSGQTKTVSFTMPESGRVLIESFWPSSVVKKSEVRFLVQ